MKTLYLNEEKSEELLWEMRGPSACLLNIIKDVLVAGNFFPEHAFDGPEEPVDLFFFYSHAVRSLEHYQLSVLIDKSARAEAVERLVQLTGAQKILSAPEASQCWDFLIVFDVLLSEHLSLYKERLDVSWIYEVLSRALPKDGRLDYILSRPNDFVDAPISEWVWD
jgi:hypothetical protein